MRRLLALPLLAALVGGGLSQLSSAAPATRPGDDAVVIAVIDSGLSPYHLDFRASEMPQAKTVSAPKPAIIFERSDSGVRILSGAGRWRATTWVSSGRMIARCQSASYRATPMVTTTASPPISAAFSQSTAKNSTHCTTNSASASSQKATLESASR